MIQVEPGHYFNMLYDKKKRFISYWHHINETIKIKPKKILEIGIGNQFVSRYLRNAGFKVVTLDIDDRLKPDIRGSVLDLPFTTNYFDVVCCFDVLEHLPYENISQALSDLFTLSISYVILCIPDAERVFTVSLTIPRLGEIKKLFTLPRLIRPMHIFDGEHHWEIGKKGFSLNKIKDDIQKAGFTIESTYRIFEVPKHRMFILKK